MSEEKSVWTYYQYEVGKVYGEKRFAVDDEVLRKWRTVYPLDADNEVMPGGMLAMVVLDAIMFFHTPRPPGGVHAGQSFEVLRMPRVGDELVTEVKCLEKEIKKDRKFVRVQTTTRHGQTGEVMFKGVMTTIVAI